MTAKELELKVWKEIGFKVDGKALANQSITTEDDIWDIEIKKGDRHASYYYLFKLIYNSDTYEHGYSILDDFIDWEFEGDLNNDYK